MNKHNNNSLDWDLKNSNDAANIDTKLKKRKQKKAPQNTIDNLSSTICAKGEALQHLHQNIAEIFDKPEEDDTYHPFFNISLIEDDETLPQEKKNQKQANETLRITKEQQMVSKLDVIMSTALAADAAGLSTKKSNQDIELAGSAEYNLPKLRRKTIKEKIEQPLQLDGETPENKLSASVSAIKKTKQTLGSDSLKNMPADEVFELDKEDDPNALAKLILQKTGRKPLKTKKKLSDLAKDINRLEQDGINEAAKPKSD